MVTRPKFFDDIAGMAGGAFSALSGLGEEVEQLVRARVDEAMRGLKLVRRDEFDAVAELAANARAGQEDALARLAALEARVAAVERLAMPEGAHAGRRAAWRCRRPASRQRGQPGRPAAARTQLMACGCPSAACS